VQVYLDHDQFYFELLTVVKVMIMPQNIKGSLLNQAIRVTNRDTIVLSCIRRPKFTLPQSHCATEQ